MAVKIVRFTGEKKETSRRSGGATIAPLAPVKQWRQQSGAGLSPAENYGFGVSMHIKSTFRVAGCLIWLALLIAVVVRGDGLFAVLPMLTAEMFVLTLGMPEALRRGQAKSASRTKVIGMTITAVLLTSILTAAAATAILKNYIPGGLFMLPAGNAYDHAAMLLPSVGLLTGGLIAGIRCMEEYFHADGDGLSAGMMDVLAAVAVCTVAMLDGVDGVLLVPVLAGILLLGVIVALITGRKHVRTGEKLRLELGALLKEVPAALLRTALYPAIAAAMLVFSGETRPVMAAAGLLIVELGRSTFRRDEREATGHVLIITHLVLTAAVCAAVCRYLGIEVLSGALLYAAAAVLMLLYAPLKVRMLLSGILLLAAAAASLILEGMIAGVVVAACALVSALLTIPEWRELARIHKVNKIRKKAMKSRR